MDFYIDLKNIGTEELKHIDLDRVNVSCNPPDFEPQRQYYFMAKCRQIVKLESERLGRPLYACSVTFGCQMNARDSEKLSGILKKVGFLETGSEDADFVIYNTCTVRDNANQRVFGRLGVLNGYKKKNPGMKVALCGCMMQEDLVIQKLRKSYPFVDLIFGTHNLYKFAELLYRCYAEKGMIVDIWEDTDKIVEDLPVERKYPFKSGVNIMFGCNNFCSYCIVPYVRGRERSRSPEEILREVKNLAADGVKEVMLLGQNVNSYGKQQGEESMTFPELLKEVEKVEGIERIRFMTSHPKDLSDELIQVMKESKKICRHLHLPLQSGSTAILEKMNRRYTKESYLALAEKIRREIPDISLTTDIIVGFPGETAQDAEDTIDVIKRVQFDNAFTFVYSKRTGTPAAAMEQVPDTLVRENFDKILACVQETARDRVKRFEGKTLPVLVEELNEQDSSLVTGRLSNNTVVHFPGDASLIGQIVDVTLEKCEGFYYIGSKA
ncbi:MAG: tRNA (N6-isopentenyl adenosine(37)-C2)-methylthiotransferase MiaB [Lachnospiraceae bacterium]|nr:tRNA (N6-isopentenyl adenosine(37)-C2)-methylthiotransferase MiaB [Lachnospiraceae bacterium]